MSEELAVQIFEQATIETTTGACKSCPRKDKNKTCIGCLDNAKEKVLKEIKKLRYHTKNQDRIIADANNRIYRTIEYIEQFEDAYKNFYPYVDIRHFDFKKIKEILKGEDKNVE